MHLKIPPPFIFTFFGLIMYIIDRFLPFGKFHFFGQEYGTISLATVGITIMIIALVQFKVSKTTVDPIALNKASKLVTGGIYQYSRNPMYLAMLLLLLAWGLRLGNAFNALTAAVFVAFMNRFQIIPEEKTLTQIFGKPYTQYCTLVRRWF